MWVLTAGLVLVTADSATIVTTPTLTAPPTPIPTCVDGQYAPGNAGASCRVTTGTTPTALCYDGTWDYSRSVFACAGHGGVLRWVPQLYGEGTSPAAGGGGTFNRNTV